MTNEQLIEQLTSEVAAKYKALLNAEKTQQDLNGTYQELSRQYRVHQQNGYVEGMQIIGQQIISFEQQNNLPRNWSGQWSGVDKARADYDAAVKLLEDTKKKIFSAAEQALVDAKIEAKTNEVKQQAAKESDAKSAPVAEAEAKKKAESKKRLIYGLLTLAGALIIGGIIWASVKAYRNSKNK